MKSDIKNLFGVAALTLSLAATVFAQSGGGAVSFVNSRSTKVINSQTGTPVAAGDNVVAALYWAPLGSNTFEQIGARVTVGTPLPGLYAGGTRTTGAATAGGSTGQFQVRAWSGSLATYEEAVQTPGALVGQSAVLDVATGQPEGAPPTPPGSLLAGGLGSFTVSATSNAPPTIVTHPQSQTNVAGTTAEFSVFALGTPPLSYQWLNYDTKLPSATNTSLSFFNVSLSDAGPYRVVVTNTYGMATSAIATLTVLMPPRIDVHPASTTNLAGTVAFFTLLASGSEPLAYQWQKDGFNLMETERIQGVMTSNLTISNASTTDSGLYSVLVTNLYGSVTSSPAMFSVVSTNIADQPITIPIDPRRTYLRTSSDGGALNSLPIDLFTLGLQPGDELLMERLGAWEPWGDPAVVRTYMVAVFSSTDMLLSSGNLHRVQGAIEAGVDYVTWNTSRGNLPTDIPEDFEVTSTRIQIPTGAQYLFVAAMDDYYGDNRDSNNDFSFRLTKQYSPPTITAQPQSRTNLAGTAAIFTLQTSGTGPLSYQWLKNDVDALADDGDVSGALTPMLTLINVQPADAGLYSVLVSNAYGSTLSSNASLTVWTPCVSVTAGGAGYPMGAPIPLDVRTFDCTTSNAIPHLDVVVWVSTAGTTRAIPSRTDGNGEATMYFEPLAGEFGHYDIGVSLPGQPPPAPEDNFNIVGLGFGIDGLSQRLIVGMPVTNHIELRNLTDVPLTDLSALVVGAPPNVIIQIEGPDSLAAYETNALTCILQAVGPTPAHSECQLQVTSLEGAANGLPVTIDVTAPVPRLVATPASLQRSMLRGGQTLVEVQLANMGGAPAHDVQVLIPSVPWLSLASAQRLVSLGVSETTIVTLALRPAPDLPLGSYASFIRFHAVETDLDVPFEFRCASAQQGDLLVVVTDESTYFAEGAPRVADATVTVAVGTNVVSAVTDTSGAVLFTNLTEDYYQVDVQADKHGTFSTTFLVEAGQANRIEAFLSCETVSYEWIVVTNAETDEYDIELVTTFEVAVPWPSLTIHPSDLNLCDYPADAQVNLTITNHSLIQASNLVLTFPSHSAWEIIPLTGNIGELPAQSGRVVPVSIRRKGPRGNVPSQMYGRLDYTFLGDGLTFHRRTPLLVRNANVWDCVAHPQITLDPKSLDLCGFPAETNVTFTIRNTGTMEVEGTALAFDSHRHWQIEPAVTNLGSLPAQTTRTVSVLFRKVPSSTSGASRIDGRLSCTATLEGEIRTFTRWTRLYNPNPWDCVPSPLVTIQPGHLDLCAFTSDTSVTFTLHNRGPVAAEALTLEFPSPHPHWQIEPSEINVGSLNPDETRQVPVLFRRISSATDGSSPIAGWLNYQATVEGETRSFAPAIPLYRPNAWDCVPQPPVTIWPRYINLCSLRALTNEIHFTIHNRSSIPANGGRLVFDNSHPQWKLDPPVTNLGDFLPGSTLDVPVRFIRTLVPTNGDPWIGGLFEYQATVENQTRGFPLAITLDGANDSDCFSPPPPPPPPDRTNSPPVTDYTHVRGDLLLHQRLTMTRNTFKATLNLTNNSATFPLTNVTVTLDIRDASQQPAADRFGIRLDTLSGLTAIDCTGALGTNASGTVAWTLIPATNAAPAGPTRYTVGGEISFMQGGKQFRIQLYPAPITVLPDPRLILDYFWERTAYADDPLTPGIEPTVPFAVGLIMRNEGLGTARALQIESAQPRIIDNASGLLIQFLLESAETNGQPVIPPDLTIELGDLDPNRTVQAVWWMNSSLLADFIEYQATFTHLNDLGQRNLSLIDHVSSRPLLHVVRADVPLDDGISDFLVSEGYPTNVLPESLYFSDGPIAPVAAVTNGVMHGAPGPATTNVQLTADLPAGWVYVRVHDPAPTSVVLSSVQRSDGRLLIVRSNVWSTHRNIYPVGGIPYREDWLHLLDYITNAGPQTYTLGYNIAPEPPIITSQPLSVTNLVGSNAVFSVVATGTEPLSYQWFHDGDLDLRSTGPDLHLSSITTNDAGNYYVQVSNAAGPTNSTAAYLKVLVPPVLCPVTNYVVPVGTYLVITNCAEDLDEPITFRLGTNAPVGAAMTTDGLFTWTPTCAQGSKTYEIRVWATDSGEPPASNSITFMVTVPECIEASLGRTVMQAGTTNSVSIHLLSTTALTNMGFTVVYPPERFTTNFTLVVNSPQVLTQSLEVIDPGQVQVGFTLPADTVLYGPTAVGELGFTAVPSQSSAFVLLQVSDVTGLKPDGTNVANRYGYPGRVVVIGPEPLLEAWRLGQTNVALRLYGNPGSNYLMSWTTNLPATTWTPGWWSEPLTNLWETWEIPPTEPQLYFRAE